MLEFFFVQQYTKIYILNLFRLKLLEKIFVKRQNSFHCCFTIVLIRLKEKPQFIKAVLYLASMLFDQPLFFFFLKGFPSNE